MDSKKISARDIIPHYRVHLGAGTTQVPVPGQQQEIDPKVILIRDGDSVQAIEVVCRCGQKIRLKCVY